MRKERKRRKKEKKLNEVEEIKEEEKKLKEAKEREAEFKKLELPGIINNCILLLIYAVKKGHKFLLNGLYISIYEATITQPTKHDAINKGKFGYSKLITDVQSLISGSLDYDFGKIKISNTQNQYQNKISIIEKKLKSWTQLLNSMGLKKFKNPIQWFNDNKDKIFVNQKKLIKSFNELCISAGNKDAIDFSKSGLYFNYDDTTKFEEILEDLKVDDDTYKGKTMEQINKINKNKQTITNLQNICKKNIPDLNDKIVEKLGFDNDMRTQFAILAALLYHKRKPEMKMKGK